METGTLALGGTTIKYSVLRDRSQRWMQFYYTIVPDYPEQISEQLRRIENAEAELLKTFSIEDNTVAAKRFFSSDLVNHRDALDTYKKSQNTDFYCSVIEQPPASCVKLALMGMCLSNITDKFRDGNVFYFDTTSGIRHIFFEHLVDPDATKDSAKQTERIFAFLNEKLTGFNTSIEDSVLRTWLYARHIDADYPAIVQARKEFFDSIHLTQETHYIASTCIQGGSGDPFARVSIDAYAVTGIDKRKIRYIEAPEYLSPTHVYDVTFERATAVELGNTDYLLISGTASIDRHGEIVHPGDIVKQTERTLTNISALLDSGGFTKNDLLSLVVYIRNASDYGLVAPLVNAYAENLPAIFVEAPVCRPGWLIEIEATAAKAID